PSGSAKGSEPFAFFLVFAAFERVVFLPLEVFFFVAVFLRRAAARSGAAPSPAAAGAAACAAFFLPRRAARSGAAASSASHSSSVSDAGSVPFGIFAFFALFVTYGP